MKRSTTPCGRPRHRHQLDVSRPRCGRSVVLLDDVHGLPPITACRDLGGRRRVDAGEAARLSTQDLTRASTGCGACPSTAPLGTVPPFRQQQEANSHDRFLCAHQPQRAEGLHHARGDAGCRTRSTSSTSGRATSTIRSFSRSIPTARSRRSSITTGPGGKPYHGDRVRARSCCISPRRPASSCRRTWPRNTT